MVGEISDLFALLLDRPLAPEPGRVRGARAREQSSGASRAGSRATAPAQYLQVKTARFRLPLSFRAGRAARAHVSRRENARARARHPPRCDRRSTRRSSDRSEGARMRTGRRSFAPASEITAQILLNCADVTIVH